MTVRIYSTLTGREEPLVPISADGTVRMYVCGMTPKYHPHVGHARLFVAMDMIRRYLEYRGYAVKHVQNFTDIDDKIIQRAQREGRDAFATAKAYSESYFTSMDRLNVQRAHVYPTVTGSMGHIIDFVQGLIDSGHAYEAEGDVYFGVATFPDYGKLSHRDLNSQLVAARKELEPGKRDPRDFALWKRAKPGEPAWESPWGAGRPGWHIECSTMVRDTLGDQIDIHGGGADLIFPHHENEIAQSEALLGKTFSQHWVHAGVLTIGSEKMAHSLENFTTINDVLDRYEPAAVRLFLLGGHYRQPMAFVLEDGETGAVAVQARGIEDARAGLTRLRTAVGDEPLQHEGALAEDAVARFEAAMDADFNTPDALAAIYDLAREVNRRRAAGHEALDAGRRTIVRLLGVLGIDLLGGERVRPADGAEPFVDLLLEVRQKMREAKQWALADEIRDRLGTLGVAVEDKPGNQSTWRWSD
ncbi:MAG: cysteine--tRNA ligase [Chloroflexi bacterium]|nr:cysteine--tRNA ligase [Chloroflexota bacterium]